MSIRTLLLIFGLTAITAVLIVLAISPKKITQQLPTTSQLPTPTPSVAHTTLTMLPNPVTISSASGSVNVMINTNDNNVTAAQLEIAYDPKVLTNVTISQGDFFTTPFILLNTKDAIQGRLSYALGIPPSGTAKQGQGIVATISFMSNLTAGQKTNITLLPKSLVTASGITTSVLSTASGTTIMREETRVSPF